MATAAEYIWRQNIACIATYRILEGDIFLDQFEDSVLPFVKAGNVKLGSLRYWPRTTTNPDIIDGISFAIARDFSIILAKNYMVYKEHAQDTSQRIITEIASVFRNPELKILNLAAVVDKNLKFQDER